MKNFGNCIWIIIVPLGFGVLTRITRQAGWSMMPVIILTISVLVPLKAFKISSRIQAVLGLLVLMSVVSVALQIDSTTPQPSLKTSNPDQYLELLKTNNEVKWMQELQTMEPSEYNMELKKLEEQAFSIPATDLQENLNAYNMLAKIDPKNKIYASKVEHYKSKIKSEKQKRKDAKKWDKLCNDSKVDAYQYAGGVVKSQLKAPRTAKLSSYGNTNITVHQNCEYVVSGYVDSQNGFGAQLR